MFVYIVALLIIVYSVCICDINSIKKPKQFFFVLELIILLLIISFQQKMGVDNLAYEDAFWDIPKLYELDADKLVIGSQLQPFWYLVSSTSKTIVDSYRFFLIIHAVVINVVIFYFFKKNTPYVFTAILCYVVSMNYFYFNLDILRESLAVSCFLCSIPYLEKKERKKYYAMCIIAFLFHISALFLFLVPFIIRYLRNVRNVKLFIIKLVLFTIPFVILFNYVLNAFVGSEGLVLIMSQADHYNSLEKNFGHSLIAALFGIVPALIVLYIRYKRRMPADIFALLTYVYIFLVLCNAFITGLTRVSNYFIFPYYICVINTIYLSFSQLKYRRLSYACLMIMMIIVVYDYSTPIGNDSYAKVTNYIPYRSIFD